MATENTFEPLTGSCTCKTITYSLLASPLCTHCCHCTYCQRESGSAFAVNIFIEASNVKITSKTSPISVHTPTASGRGLSIARCPTCFVGLWSYYDGSLKIAAAVKAGSLDNGSRERIKPDVHIFTSTKLDWVDLSKEEERGAKVFEEYYDRKDVWSKESLERLNDLMKSFEGADQTSAARGD